LAALSTRIADEASAAIRTAQDALDEQVRRAALTNDPLRHYLAAMSLGLAAMHKLFVDGALTLGQQIAAATKPPLSTVDVDQIGWRVVSSVMPTVEEAFRKLVRTNRWLVAGVLVCAVVLLAAPTMVAWHLAYSYGFEAAENRLASVPADLQRELSGGEAAVWLTLMRNNDIRSATRQCEVQNGRKACDFSLWTEAKPLVAASDVPPPPIQGQAAAAPAASKRK
jgi:hypothetical protein